jgi:SRSO17 transposase
MGASESLEVPAEFAAFHERFSARFVRAEVRERSARYLQGLLGPVERKNGWQLAEAAGERDPAGMQRLLYAAAWEADEVLGDYQTWAVEQFGNPAAIVVFDETGFVKKGTKSVGVQRQYSGTAGKVENCQVGVFMAYVTPSSHVLLDRRLYPFAALRAGCASGLERRPGAADGSPGASQHDVPDDSAIGVGDAPRSLAARRAPGLGGR